MRSPGSRGLALLVGLSALLGVATPAGAIVGGTAATASGPTVSLQMKTGSNTTVCTGTLVARSVVLTAAHCVEDPDQVRVRMGLLDRTALPTPENDFIVTRVREMRDFEKRDPDKTGPVATKPNDLAFLDLGRPAVQAPAGITYKTPAVGTDALARGYGTTAENADGTTPESGKNTLLREANLRMTTCPKNAFSDVVCADYAKAKPKAGPCRGDSGGALFTLDTKKVAAVFSGVGSECKSVARYADLSKHKDFVAEILSPRITGRVFDSTKVAAATAAGARPDDARIAAKIGAAVVKAKAQDGTLEGSTPVKAGRFVLPVQKGTYDLELIAPGFTTVLADDVVVTGPRALDGGMVPGVSVTPPTKAPEQRVTIPSAERRPGDKLVLEVAVNTPPKTTHKVVVTIVSPGIDGAADVGGGAMSYTVKRPVSTSVPFALKGTAAKHFGVGERVRITVTIDGKVARETTKTITGPVKGTSR